ncbi:MAG: SsrA-binding protein SmpB [Deltaproteobacteria bacterium]
MAKKKAPKLPDGVKVIVKNRKARFDYTIVDEVEAGVVLQGTEVKSLRDGKIQLADAYAMIDNGQAYLHHAHIAEYTNGNIYNHDPIRTRKLLLHRREIDRLNSKVREKGLTLIPLDVYFKNGRVKINLGLCKGKAHYDKRAAIRERDEKRDLRGEE